MTFCREKRETERITREIEHREMEEALALVKASKGKSKLKVCRLLPCLAAFALSGCRVASVLRG